MKLKHILIIPALLTPSVAVGQTYSFALASTNTGWVDDSGFGNNDNPNYIAGSIDNAEYRNYFTFDLSNVLGTITEATITITMPDGGIVSDDANEIFALSSVGSVVDVNDVISGNTSLFNDLGDGGFIGSSILTSASGTVNINLNQEFLDNANNSNKITIGGSLISLEHDGDTEYTFGYSGQPNDDGSNIVSLNLTVDPNGGSVPEPSSAILISLGASTLLVRRKR